MDNYECNRIRAKDAKRYSDKAREYLDNEEAIKELQHIYDQIHDAINCGKYEIHAYTHYQYVLSQLRMDGYSVGFTSICEESSRVNVKDREVAIITINWEGK